MSPTQSADRRTSGVRKRASNACHRCRQQKIRCSGRFPCEQCTKRDLVCQFEDKNDRVFVSRSFLHDLERRATGESRPVSASGTQSSNDGNLVGAVRNAPTCKYTAQNGIPRLTDSANHISNEQEQEHELPNDDDSGDVMPPAEPSSVLRPGSETRSATPTAQLTNPFSTHAPRYFADRTGRAWYLGTSSNWGFTRHVLGMVYERITGQQALTDSAYSTVYELGWDGQRDLGKDDNFSMPSSDYAIYLINAVKFHCGQVFHLFDETTFMQHFAQFQAGEPNIDTLWYIHFLVILAFGKVFVTRRNETRKPPGADLFVQAMKMMPDLIYVYLQPVDSLIQCMEIFTCMALYLQCLDYRGPAYDMIGRALRLALEEGMHTNMDDRGLSAPFVQRCRNVWWTIYILDRQFSSWMGSPININDEDISACLPTSSGTLQRGLALELNVKLSRTLAQILNTVYGSEGRLTRKFMASTKNALKSIADVTSALKRSFDLPTNGRHGGISRLAAHLHLLHDQCIVLAIRPLLFSLLKLSLDHPRKVQSIAANSNSARTLLQICLESSQHIIVVLDKLREQDLLETFLPFDLEAANAASMIVLLTPTVDSSLLQTSFPWLNMLYSIFDEMVLQGNIQAAQRKAELEQLHQAFMQMPHNADDTAGQGADIGSQADMHGMTQGLGTIVMPHEMAAAASGHDFNIDDDIFWRNAFTADQLLNVADNLDLDGIEWMTTGSSN